MTASLPRSAQGVDAYLGMRTQPSQIRVSGYRQDDGAGQERG